MRQEVPEGSFPQPLAALLGGVLLGVVEGLSLLVALDRAGVHAQFLAVALSVSHVGVDRSGDAAEHDERALRSDPSADGHGVERLALGAAALGLVDELELLQLGVGAVLAAGGLDLLERLVVVALGVVDVLGEAGLLIDEVVDVGHLLAGQGLVVLTEVVPLRVVDGVHEDPHPRPRGVGPEVDQVRALAVQEDALQAQVDVCVTRRVDESAETPVAEVKPLVLVQVADHVDHQVAGVQQASRSFPPAAGVVGGLATHDRHRVAPVEEDGVARDARRGLLVDDHGEELGSAQVENGVGLDDLRTGTFRHGGRRVRTRDGVVPERVPRPVVAVTLHDLDDVGLEVQTDLGAADAVAEGVALLVGSDLRVEVVGQTDVHPPLVHGEDVDRRAVGAGDLRGLSPAAGALAEARAEQGHWAAAVDATQDDLVGLAVAVRAAVDAVQQAVRVAGDRRVAAQQDTTATPGTGCQSADDEQRQEHTPEACRATEVHEALLESHWHACADRSD